MADAPLITLCTPPHPGAIAILQITGPAAGDLLRRLTGHDDWPPGRLRLGALSTLDRGLAVLLREDWVQLMPHGGPLLVRRLVERLTQLGAAVGEPSPRQLFPEATDDLEAQMLVALSRAASPAAVELLLAQPRLWRAEQAIDRALLERSRILDRLITPPTVVVVGRPNVGKSTLSNRILGRQASVVADLPGTTRDWVGGLALLRGVAVHWIDTPGIRHSDDVLEQSAIELAQRVVSQADLIVALRDPTTHWPEMPSHALRVLNKCDIGQGEADLCICAASGQGVGALEQAVLERLGLANLSAQERWAFSPQLKAQA